jgi:hypothetical protein
MPVLMEAFLVRLAGARFAGLGFRDIIGFGRTVGFFLATIGFFLATIDFFAAGFFANNGFAAGFFANNGFAAGFFANNGFAAGFFATTFFTWVFAFTGFGATTFFALGLGLINGFGGALRLTTLVPLPASMYLRTSSFFGSSAAGFKLNNAFVCESNKQQRVPVSLARVV